jgi:hypothetical protein
MKMPLHMLPWRQPQAMALVALLACALAQAASPLPAVQQAALERAVADYQAGRHAAARVALQALARQQVPAAQYNLAVMHLRAKCRGPACSRPPACCGARRRAVS